MNYEIDLISNGKIENYPKSVFMGIVRNKHWRELILASQSDDEFIFEQQLTAILDDLIDFKKTEYIKSSSQLTKPDRLKLFLFQRINGLEEKDYVVKFNCIKCEARDIDKIIDLSTLPENKLMKKVKEKEIKKLGYKINLTIPTAKGYLKIEELKRDYIEDFYNNNKFETSTKFEEWKIENYFTIKDLAPENIEKVYSKYLDDIIDYNKEIIKKSNLKELFLSSDTDIILNSEQIYFQSEFNTYLSYFPIFKEPDFTEKENIIKEFILFMDDLPKPVMGDIENYVKEIYHGYDNVIEFECPECKNKFFNLLPLRPSFFFK